MKSISKDELNVLMKNKTLRAFRCLCPLSSGARNSANQIRLRNLLREAEEQLLAGGARPAEAKKLLESPQNS